MDFKNYVVYCIEIFFHKASNTYSVWAGGWEVANETDRATAYKVAIDLFQKRRRVTLFPENTNRISFHTYTV